MQLCTGEWHKSKVAGRNPFGISRNVKTSLSEVSTDDETFRHRRNVETMRNVKTSAIRFNQSKCPNLHRSHRSLVFPVLNLRSLRSQCVPCLESSFPSFP